MKKTLLTCVLVSLLIGTDHSYAQSAAQVTEVVNQVDYGMSQTTDTRPAKVGTFLQDGEYLKTGERSRAEVALANKTITRLGANTIFNYSVVDNQIDLQSGTLLFSKPKNGATMTIKTAAVTAAVTGTTGFVQKQGNTFLFGLVEGHVTITSAGKPYVIASGEILRLTPGTAPQIFSFDVPLFLSTCPLINKFPHDLPNEAAIKREVAAYNDLVGRGFIQPPSNPFYLLDPAGNAVTQPLPAFDSAGQAHANANRPPAPPQSNPCPPPPPPPPPYDP